MKQIQVWRGRRRFLAGSIATLFAGMFTSCKAIGRKSAEKGVPRLGVNLAGIEDWSTEQPFVDFFKMSREWVSQTKGGQWGDGPNLSLDTHGWVKSLPDNVFATRIICSVENGHYPSGEYTVYYEGEGELKADNHAAKVVDEKPGKLLIKVNAAKGTFKLDLVKTNSKNPLRNVRIIAPGFDGAKDASPWHPNFLKRWAGVACIRTMDMMATNHSKQAKWQDRPMLEDASYTKKGVPVELMVDLANRLNSDLWCCMPHLADDQYVESFARYVKQHLKPALKVWVEYSNEVWNNIFAQTKYATQKGMDLGFSGNAFEAGGQYTAHRSIEIFNTFHQVYGDASKRIVNVLSGFAASTQVAEYVLDYKAAAEMADVLAIAPYITMNVSPGNQSGLDDKTVSNWSLDQVFKHLETVALPESKQWINNHKELADGYGLKLVAYESGQHLLGIQGAENNDKLTQLLMKANADKRMGGVYAKNLLDWKNAGGDLICSFLSMGHWSKWGSWGLLRNQDEDPKQSPKFKAVIDWAKKHGQKMGY